MERIRILSVEFLKQVGRCRPARSSRNAFCEAVIIDAPRETSYPDLIARRIFSKAFCQTTYRQGFTLPHHCPEPGSPFWNEVTVPHLRENSAPD
jgi:hypothetical protein